MLSFGGGTVEGTGETGVLIYGDDLNGVAFTVDGLLFADTDAHLPILTHLEALQLKW